MQIWAELRYDLGRRGVPIARTQNPEILRLIKRDVVARARANAEESALLDEVVAVIEEAELRKLEHVLAMVIPEEDAT